MKQSTPSTALRAALLGSLLALLPAAARAQEIQVREPNRGGEVNLEARDPAVALQRLTPAPGYEVSLFASERDFPLVKPVAMAFDSRGRLWVSAMPTYPQYRPGDPPTDKLLVLEDTNGDGRADKHTVFADSLYLALGFELGDGGVYVSQQPNLVFLKDNDGDGRADERRILLHGFGTEDSHHAIHAFTWGPDGGLYMQEGTFHHSQVETPWGPVRDEYATIFRYEPRTERLGVFVSYRFANPWGHLFDRWGQNFIADASNGNNYFGLPLTGRVEYLQKHPEMQVFTTRVRPTGGAELVSSRHFPDDVQGNFLVTNTIGFHGIKSHRVIEEGSGFTSVEAEPLLVSSDINFRPIDMEFGPDGALYLVDWFNPLVGHMQYSLRDPRRDREHGRIWRVTYRGRPLLQPVNLEALPVPALLDQLREYEDRTRYRARRELRVRDAAEVRRALSAWTAALDRNDPEYERLLLEALWVTQTIGDTDTELLGRLLRAREPRVRAAATRAIRFAMDRLPDALALLRRQVEDEHPRVRLEAVVALSHLRSPEAAETALLALRHPMDYYLRYGLGETVTTLERHWKPVLLAGRPFAADNPEGVLFLIDRLKPEEVARVALAEPVSRALLWRAEIPIETRRAAMRDLAARQGVPGTTVMLNAARSAAGAPGGGSAARDLLVLLGEAPQEELRRERGSLEQLARAAADPLLRQAAYVGLMRADGDLERTWRMASASRRGMMDLLDAAAVVQDPALRAALYPRVRALLQETLSTPGAAQEGGVSGRYVRIELPGCCETQSLAEVQVFDGTRNLAPSGTARQKSTALGGEAGRAIDGSTEGNFRLGSVSQSAVMEADPWWELDLGESRPISSVVVWKRTDDPLSAGDLSGFHLRVLDSDRKPVFEREGNDAATQPVTFQVGGDSVRLLRRAAVVALAALPGPAGERLPLFTDLLRRGVEADLALAGAASLAAGLRGAEAAAMADQVLAVARRIPAADRSGPTFKRAAELTRTLAASLPAADGARLTARLEALLPRLVRIRAVPSQMRFDIGEFTAAPGQEVELVFENPDEMPHNVVFTAPGAREKVGRAADAMAARPDAFQKNFVPDLPEVLAATPLISTGQSTTLRFRAPDARGDYPFICTFPAHWITMVGTMKVGGE